MKSLGMGTYTGITPEQDEERSKKKEKTMANDLPTPRGVTAPRPVTTTRRMASLRSSCGFMRAEWPLVGELRRRRRRIIIIRIRIIRIRIISKKNKE